MQRACAHLGLCFSATTSHQRLRSQPNGAPDRAHAPSDRGGPGTRVCAPPPGRRPPQPACPRGGRAGLAPAPSPGLGNSDPLERLWCQERTRERFLLKLPLAQRPFLSAPCHGPSLAETAVEEPPFFFAPRDVRRCARFPLTPVRAAAFRSLPGLRTARASLGTSASGRNLRICCEEEAAEPEAACGTEAPGTSGPSPCGSHRGARAPES